MNPRQLYPIDLTDEAWDVIKSLLPEAKPGGRPEAYPTRQILSGLFYLLRHGCSWCMLPHDLPPWRTVYYAFWPWRKDGTWEVMHDLRRGDVRLALGRQRHSLVDTLGLLLGVVVTAANGPDRAAAESLLACLRYKFSRLRCIWADQT